MSHPLSNVAIGFCAVGFAIMGIVAILSPKRVTQQFDIPDLSVAGKNEIRAVYGGFGLAIGAMLVGALVFAPVRAGICFTVGAALAGMATGRVLSVVIDRTILKFPLIYLLIEALGAVMLFYAA